ncbi:hypothetical protein LTR10_022215 [Elasticomyces elasticus]|uniref:Uncharacterized protein n=1 Tax=Exophiala sideris TaxID=1016849 RepID=A0ABR0JIU8_9EURO|nr:hypothetical protein LTR10_022215 [Elasticomyces elasticus]KAK5034393.1 hypothetical protein LTS07_003314 [Exophiala sideris]KAK5042690.1 hypothetical protein LTR13_001538 [Exophiala sideris]KAK5065772.1 hypothetical protein LTR69_003322 [Exophiala sideris]KAK5185768.1 hypothetical protein LTR44_001817 [Eurotiomycetes sp. CCFEE 6388]
MSQSIRSMYKWYRDAEICYAYLYDVDSTIAGTSKFRAEKALRRGWTLQELLAPKNVRFYDFQWEKIGTKAGLAKDISDATKIHPDYLREHQAFRRASIATKMSWLARRITTWDEDMAYSTLGIFGVRDLVPMYGEGMSAFLRLQLALVSRQDESLYAWKLPEHTKKSGIPGWAAHEWGLLAPEPLCFRDSAAINLDGKRSERYLGGFNVSGPGVSFWHSLKEHTRWGKVWRIPRTVRFKTLTLNCWTKVDSGKLKAIQITIRQESKHTHIFRRQNSHTWKISKSGHVPETIFKRKGNGNPKVAALVFAQPGVADDWNLDGD